MNNELYENIGECARRGKISYGLSILLPCASIVEMAKLAGYDFVRIDCEHSYMEASELRAILTTARLSGIPCQVRVADLLNITPLLNLEPSAIMVPHICSKAEVEHAVSLCKFAPLGERGMDGSTRRMRCEGMTRAEYMEYAKTHMDLIVQIESKEGLERIDEILCVAGVDMVATGRADLSQALGVPGDKNAPEVIEAEEYIIRKTLEHGKIPMIAADNAERVARLKQMGVNCFLIGKDETILSRALAENYRNKHIK